MLPKFLKHGRKITISPTHLFGINDYSKIALSVGCLLPMLHLFLFLKWQHLCGPNKKKTEFSM